MNVRILSGKCLRRRINEIERLLPKRVFRENWRQYVLERRRLEERARERRETDAGSDGVHHARHRAVAQYDSSRDIELSVGTHERPGIHVAHGHAIVTGEILRACWRSMPFEIVARRADQKLERLQATRDQSHRKRACRYAQREIVAFLDEIADSILEGNVDHDLRVALPEAREHVRQLFGEPRWGADSQGCREAQR